MYQKEAEANVTDDPGSKPDQRHVRRRDRQNYIRKIQYKFTKLDGWLTVHRR
jgi:hypothetical protein